LLHFQFPSLQHLLHHRQRRLPLVGQLLLRRQVEPLEERLRLPLVSLVLLVLLLCPFRGQLRELVLETCTSSARSDATSYWLLQLSTCALLASVFSHRDS
jgi:hypothetical protein